MSMPLIVSHIYQWLTNFDNKQGQIIDRLVNQADGSLTRPGKIRPWAWSHLSGPCICRHAACR